MLKSSKKHLFLIWNIGICVILAKKTNDLAQTSKLYKHLLSGYNRSVKPVSDSVGLLDVRFGAAIIEVLEIDEQNGHMSTNMWLTMSWSDVSLHWHPADYGEIKQLHIPADQLWLPDVIMSNGFEWYISTDMDAIVSHNGTVMWVAPSLMKLTCRHEFRGNLWVCPMYFSSWTYSGDELNLSPSEDPVQIDTSHYLSGKSWGIVGRSGRREVIKNTGGESYPVMEYVLKLQNKSFGSILG